MEQAASASSTSTTPTGTSSAMSPSSPSSPSDQLRFVVTPRIKSGLARACAHWDQSGSGASNTSSLDKETREALRRLHKAAAPAEVTLALLRQLSRVLVEIGHAEGAYLHELLQGSRPIVPRPPPPPKKTPEQEAKLQKLQVELDNKRYASMVKNVVATKDMQEGKQKNEYREAMKQASLGVDMIVAIVVGFVTGYFIFSRWGTVPGVVGGTLIGVAIMLVEMALIVIRGSRIEKEEETKDKKKFVPKKTSAANSEPRTIISSTTIPAARSTIST